MQKNIPFRGLTTTPSPHDCPDGDLAAVLNLVPEDGAMKPLHEPYRIGRMEKGARLWVHETPDFLHLIKALENGTWWWADMKEDSDFASLDWAEITGITGEVTDVSYDGFVVVVATSDNPLQHVCWDASESGYTYIGSKPDFRMDFFLQGTVKTDSTNNIYLGDDNDVPTGGFSGNMGYNILAFSKEVGYNPRCSDTDIRANADHRMTCVGDKAFSLDEDDNLDSAPYFYVKYPTYNVSGLEEDAKRNFSVAMESSFIGGTTYRVFNNSEYDVAVISRYWREIQLTDYDYLKVEAVRTKWIQRIPAGKSILWTCPKALSFTHDYTKEISPDKPIRTVDETTTGSFTGDFEFIDFIVTSATCSSAGVDATDPWYIGQEIRLDFYTLGGATIKKSTPLGDTDTHWYVREDETGYNACKAAINNFCNTYGTHNNTIYPFFVKYGLRKTNGNYLYESAPILMCPNWRYSPALIVTDPKKDGVNETAVVWSSVIVTAFVAELKYKISGNLSAWKDVIEAIDICVSPPLQWINWGEEPEDNYRKIAAYLFNESHLAYYKGYLDTESSNIDSLKALWDSIKSYGTADNHLLIVPPLYSEDAFKTQFLNTVKFYKAKSIDLQTLENDDYDVWKNEIDETFNFLSMEGQTEITMSAVDDTEGQITATGLKAYNGRIHAFGVNELNDIGISAAFSPMLHTSDVQYRLMLVNRKNGVNYVSMSGWLDGDPQKAMFAYCKDDDANKFAAYVKTNGSYYIISPSLTDHQQLGGRYAYNINDNISSVSSTKDEAEVDSSVYAEPQWNSIYVTDVDDPFNFPVANTVQVGRGKVVALAVNTEAVSEGQFGDAPLYVFTTEETWLLSLNSDAVYAAKQPIENAKCINPNSICELPHGVIFATVNGIIYAQGAQMTCISDGLKDAVSQVSLPHLGKVMAAKGLASYGDKMSDYVYDEDWQTFLENCGTAYDKINNRLIIYPGKDSEGEASDLTFIYSMKSNMWGMQGLDITGTVGKANACWVINDRTEKVSGEGEETDEYQILYDMASTDYAEKTDTVYDNQYVITRPIALDAPDVMKRVHSMIAKGYFRKGNVATAMYGSRDLFNWRLVWTSKDHYLRGFTGTPYKYYRVVLVCSMKGDERLQGVNFDYDGSMTNQMR